jgi:glycosyltransferase involved in cell wall biosynthesis
MSRKLKIALVHDFLVVYGGGERVVEALHQLFPEAPLYVAFVDKKALGMHWQRFADWQVHESWMRYIPLYKKFFSPLRVLAPHAFASFDLSEYDVVISSSNAYFSKAVRVRKNDPHGRPDAVHICYCHTPPRSLYGYSTMTNWRQHPLARWVGTLMNHYLRVVDVKIAQQVDFFIANSQETAARIAKFYRRDSTVIYPPVNVPGPEEIKGLAKRSTGNASEYFLYVNRLAFAKHPELAVEACTELRLPLKVVGSGKMFGRLAALAGPTIELLGAVSDNRLAELYAGATALLYPVEDEDFGIVPVEAMGHGVPVIAHRSGGPKETIIDGQTGIFFDDLTVSGMISAIRDFQTQQKKQPLNRQKIATYAQKFSAERFGREMREFVKKVT